jgi:hypothetical protein
LEILGLADRRLTVAEVRDAIAKDTAALLASNDLRHLGCGIRSCLHGLLKAGIVRISGVAGSQGQLWCLTERADDFSEEAPSPLDDRRIGQAAELTILAETGEPMSATAIAKVRVPQRAATSTDRDQKSAVARARHHLNRLRDKRLVRPLAFPGELNWRWVLTEEYFESLADYRAYVARLETVSGYLSATRPKRSNVRRQKPVRQST